MATENREATDIQVAGSLVVAGLLSDEGLQALQQVLQGAEDPVAAVGNAVFMALGKVREKLEEQGMSIDDKLWVAKGGVLDRVLFEVIAILKTVLGVEQAGTAEFASALKGSVIELMEQEDAGGGQEQAPMGAEQGGMQAPPQGPPQGPQSPLLGGV